MNPLPKSYICLDLYDSVILLFYFVVWLTFMTRVSICSLFEMNPRVVLLEISHLHYLTIALSSPMGLV